jgi:hypothetical protein
MTKFCIRCLRDTSHIRIAPYNIRCQVCSRESIG